MGTPQKTGGFASPSFDGFALGSRMGSSFVRRNRVNEANDARCAAGPGSQFAEPSRRTHGARASRRGREAESRRRRQTVRVEDVAVLVDDDRLDTGHATDEFHAALDAENEDGLR